MSRVCKLRTECKKVRIGECDKYHAPCQRGVYCPLLKRKNCPFHHPLHHFYPGHTLQACPLVRIGKCHKGLHPKCDRGKTCKFLKTRECNFYHPAQHFAITKTSDSQTTTSKSTLSSSDHAIIQQLHPSKPNRHGDTWEDPEKTQLRQHIQNNPDNPKDAKFVKEFATEWSRKESAVRIRIDKMIKDSKTANDKNAKPDQTPTNTTTNNNQINGLNVNVIDLTGNSDNLFFHTTTDNLQGIQSMPKLEYVNEAIDIERKKVMDLLLEIERYRAKQKNKYEVANIRHLRELVMRSKWRDMIHLEEIMGCKIEYLNQVLDGLKREYGELDRERRNHKIEYLMGVKQRCLDQAKNIDNIIVNLKKEDWFGGNTEFIKITNHSLGFFYRLNESLNRDPVKQESNRNYHRSRDHHNVVNEKVENHRGRNKRKRPYIDNNNNNKYKRRRY